MARKHDRGRQRAVEPAAEPVEDSSGSLADAISAHLELKQEHGADPDTVEQERQSALAPALRDRDTAAVLPAAPPPAEETELFELAPAAESLPVEPPPIEPRPAEPQPVESPPVEFPPAEPPSAESPPAESPLAEPPPTEPLLPTEETGNFEFDWDREAEQSPAGEQAETTAPQADAPDVLEQTPEFFEETPEYDRLWFEERPPRDFDF